MKGQRTSEREHTPPSQITALPTTRIAHIVASSSSPLHSLRTPRRRRRIVHAREGCVERAR